MQIRRECRLDRLRYYKQQSEAICQDVVSSHRRQGIPMSPYLEQTSKIATSAGCLLRRGRNIHRFDTFGKFVRWPSYSYASTNLVIDYGTTAEAVFAFCLRDGCAPLPNPEG